MNPRTCVRGMRTIIHVGWDGRRRSVALGSPADYWLTLSTVGRGRKEPPLKASVPPRSLHPSPAPLRLTRGRAPAPLFLPLKF